MRVILTILAFGSAAGLSVPAAAQTGGLFLCPALGVTLELRDKVADMMISGNLSDETVIDQLLAVTNGCASHNGLPDAKAKTYYEYNLYSLTQGSVAARLKTAGISVKIIEDAFDLGEGRSNPDISNDYFVGRLEILDAALTKGGIDFNALPQTTRGLIRGYAAMTSLMWNSRRELKEAP